MNERLLKDIFFMDRDCVGLDGPTSIGWVGLNISIRKKSISLDGSLEHVKELLAYFHCIKPSYMWMQDCQPQQHV